MTPIKLPQDGPRFQHALLIRRQQRHYLALEHRAKRVRPRTPRVRLAPLRRERPVLPFARAPHAHCGCRRCRLLRLAFHPSSPQHPDLRVLHHGASPPGSTSSRAPSGRPPPANLIVGPANLIVADHLSTTNSPVEGFSGQETVV